MQSLIPTTDGIFSAQSLQKQHEQQQKQQLLSQDDAGSVTGKVVTNRKELVATVKSWTELDSKLKAINKMATKIRAEKKLQNEQLIAVMKEHHIDEFTLKNGIIQHRSGTRKEPLTQKRLLEILKTHPQLKDEQAEALNTYVYDSRKMIEVESVVCINHDGTQDD
jgi:hypothetical protein